MNLLALCLTKESTSLCRHYCIRVSATLLPTFSVNPGLGKANGVFRDTDTRVLKDFRSMSCKTNSGPSCRKRRISANENAAAATPTNGAPTAFPANDGYPALIETARLQIIVCTPTWHLPVIMIFLPQLSRRLPSLFCVARLIS